MKNAKKIEFNGVMFDEITQQDFDKINPDTIVFFAYAEGGAMGWPDTIQIMTKSGKDVGLFFIDYATISDMKVVEEKFPKLANAIVSIFEKTSLDLGWTHYYLGFGNHLFVRKDVNGRFIQQAGIGTILLDPPKLYKNWANIALSLLDEHM